MTYTLVSHSESNEIQKMKFSEIEHPYNRKFGFFFTFVFVVVAAYFYHSDNVSWAYLFIATALVFLLITLIERDALLPLNKLWMRFELLLGMIVSPILLGIIFFGLFTPIAILMRLSGRDELRLKFTQKASHWISRGVPIICTPIDAFKCFMGTEMNVLAVGNYVLYKEQQDEALKENYEERYELD